MKNQYQFDCVLHDGTFFEKRGMLQIQKDKLVFYKKRAWPLLLVSAVLLAVLIIWLSNVPASAVSDGLSVVLFIVIVLDILVLSSFIYVLAGLPLGLGLGIAWRRWYRGKYSFEIPAKDIVKVEQKKKRADRLASWITLNGGGTLVFSVRSCMKASELGEYSSRINELLKQKS